MFVTGKQNFRFFSPFIRKTNISPREEGWGGRELEVFSSPLESSRAALSEWVNISEQEWMHEWANERMNGRMNQTIDCPFTENRIKPQNLIYLPSRNVLVSSATPEPSQHIPFMVGTWCLDVSGWAGGYTHLVCECYWMFAIMACAVWSADDRMSGCLLRPGYSEIKLRQQPRFGRISETTIFSTVKFWSRTWERTHIHIVHTSLKS